MRSIGSWMACLILGLALTSAGAFAQDAPKVIAIQITIGADGSVKVVDAKTGKEIAGAGVVNVQKQHGRAQIQIQGQQLDKKQLEKLHVELQNLLQDKKRGDAKPDDPNARVIKIERL